MPNPIGPRPYRVRIFAPDGEILANRTFITVLDMTPGLPAYRSRSELDNLLRNLADLDNLAKAKTGHYLTVTDTDTGETFTWLPR
jgi:hypothetical protein